MAELERLSCVPILASPRSRGRICGLPGTLAGHSERGQTGYFLSRESCPESRGLSPWLTEQGRELKPFLKEQCRAGRSGAFSSVKTAPLSWKPPTSFLDRCNCPRYDTKFPFDYCIVD